MPQPDILDLLDADELAEIDWSPNAPVRFVPSEQVTDQQNGSDHA